MKNLPHYTKDVGLSPSVTIDTGRENGSEKNSFFSLWEAAEDCEDNSLNKNFWIPFLAREKNRKFQLPVGGTMVPTHLFSKKSHNYLKNQQSLKPKKKISTYLDWNP